MNEARSLINADRYNASGVNSNSSILNTFGAYESGTSRERNQIFSVKSRYCSSHFWYHVYGSYCQVLTLAYTVRINLVIVVPLVPLELAANFATVALRILGRADLRALFERS